MTDRLLTKREVAKMIDKDWRPEELTDNQAGIVLYLEGRDWTSPTEIGNVVNRGKGSAWASPICKRLVVKGYLLRNAKGQYKLLRSQWPEKMRHG